MRNLLSPLSLALCFSLGSLMVAGSADGKAPSEAVEKASSPVDFGVIAPISTRVGAAALEGKDHAPLFAAWLNHKGGDESYPSLSLLVINAETGEHWQLYDKIFATEAGDPPFSWIVSRSGKFYTCARKQLIEYDPLEGRQGLHLRGSVGDDEVCMSFIESPSGLIYFATFPSGSLMEYNPDTRELRALGRFATWDQRIYIRTLALDDGGWIYAGLGNKEAMVIGMNLSNGEVKRFSYPGQTAEVTGVAATVEQGGNGKVYARYDNKSWMELSGGELLGQTDKPPRSVKASAGNQKEIISQWSDGRKVQGLDLIGKVLETSDPKTGETRKVSFTYETGGLIVMSLVAAEDGYLYGSTGLPLCFFRLDPKTGKTELTPLHGYAGHINGIAMVGHDLFGATYSKGDLIHYDLSKPYTNRIGDNPRQAAVSTRRNLSRPFVATAHPDGRHIYSGGAPSYGLLGGGMLIYDRETGTTREVFAKELDPELSPRSMAVLPDGKVAVGMTTMGGSGAVPTAREAKILIWSPEEDKVVQSYVPVPGEPEIRDLVMSESNVLHGITGHGIYFAIDPASGKSLHREDLSSLYGKVAYIQGPRILHKAGDGSHIIFFENCVVKLNPVTFRKEIVAKVPYKISVGTITREGRIFAVGDKTQVFEVSASSE